GMLINEWRLSKQNDNIMEEVSGLIIDEKENDPAKPEEDKELTPEQQWKKIKREYPNVIFPEGMQVKYAKLYATNPEFVGYLSADGVNLNLPVVQAKDDKKYLEKNFYLQKTKYGCPFVTHLNNIEPLDQNTVIFGHHMNNGTIFGTLDAYKSIEGFKKAPVITFNTLYKDYKWKVIAAIVTNAYTKDDNGYIFRYYFTQLSTQENFSAYLSELSQRSLYDTGVDVLPTDKLLTLSTCSHEFTDARFVVIARLVRPGESADVDVSRATVNSNPRYPQAWYNKKGKTNPYKNAFQWEVS
ncbi:MAG: class B sortase, partial [Clostridia bacterium]|nr:class B sortase [Clostridia bacterium]